MHRSAIGLVAILLLATGARAQERGNVTLPRYPSISPDGSQLLFSWRGDLWQVGIGGGEARRLTAHPFNDLQSAWSRDGKRIAFVSDRSGFGNIYVMNADGTGVRQITQGDRPIGMVGFGVDEGGKEVVTLAAFLEPEPHVAARPFQVGVDGGELVRMFDAFASFPAVSPDGSRVLFNRGMSSWSRRNYRGSDNRDIWMYDRGAKSFTRLTQWAGNDGRARWINNTSFVFASDRSDRCVNLYRMSLGEDETRAERLTQFKETDVEDFDVSADGRTLVFAMWDSLYSLDLTRAGAQPAPLRIQADEDEQDNVLLKDVGRSISEAALSPDGKTMAFVAYGEVYVRGTEAKSTARRVTSTTAREKDIAWSPDGETLYFTSDSSGREGIYAAKVRLTRGEVKKQIEQLRPGRTASTLGQDDEGGAATMPSTAPATTQANSKPTTQASTQPTTKPVAESGRWSDAIAFRVDEVLIEKGVNLSRSSPSPDGKSLAYERGVGQLWIKPLPDGEPRKLVDGWSVSLDWRWSPDSKYIAYSTDDENYNSDIWIARSDGTGSAVNITRHPSNDHNPRWSADGKVLSFISERINREYDVWAVYLDKELETLTPQELDQYFKDAVAKAKKREPLKPATRPATRPATQPLTMPATVPATVPATAPALIPGDVGSDLDDAYLRLRRITTFSGNEGENELTPGGDKHVFTATVGADTSLFIADHDGSAPRRIAIKVDARHLSLAGDQLVFVADGRAGIVKLPSGEIEYMDIADRIRIDLAEQSKQKFQEAARVVGDHFWDAKLNNLDWGLLTQRYLKLVEGARTSDEFDHVAARFVGELNGSHLGINSPDPVSPLARPIGRLGIVRTRVELSPTKHGYRVDRVWAEGPAGSGPMRLEAGDVITAVNLEDFERGDTLESKLAGLVGRESIVTVRRGAGGGETRELHLLITPISYAAWADLFYKQWRLDMAKRVAEWSNGRIGYIHIQGMNQPSLDVFERDLYAAAHGKDGLIIDVRNNGGGWTTDRLLASIMAPEHAYTIARGMPSGMRGYPNDRLFIARYTLPINMLCNERSFSNAEIISHAFKTLKRGTLVGQKTYGGVISTGATALIDGTTVRIPFRGWFLPDGTNQENNGAAPDILVEQTPDDEVKGSDAQLKTAVEDLMKRLKPPSR